ncbi:hypothetical protein IUY40_09305 [Flavobacterium sp. ALJ2]|uniref:hypothetical protein n=1 Tax=Flavobacterium sp. ALJ2 TaxID=2786960 RepID=UPI00189E68F2|nr:hypothetical protein [Flavobacterium sp. ALJ2]MBF7091738.1 hypothetical protein [Flavobacterium sp. ALJ2]
MKHTYIYILMFLFLISCESKAPIEVKQIISDEMVTIQANFKKKYIKDSVFISIPTEFEITITSSKIREIDLSYIINKKRLFAGLSDYEIYNKQNKTKPIYSLNTYLSSDKPIHIIIKERNHLISILDAKDLLNKYNINESLNNLKYGDTIKIVPYNKFRKDNVNIIYDLRKTNDSIIFNIWKGSGKGETILVKKKINW